MIFVLKGSESILFNQLATQQKNSFLAKKEIEFL
jgi:hypothetical protein